MRKELVCLCFVSFLCLTSASYAWDSTVVIGDWEGSTDGWVIDAPYEFYDGWSSLNDTSLKITQLSWGQMRLELRDVGHINDFMDHWFFSIDLMVPADTLGVSGWEEVYNLAINAEGYGWQEPFSKPALHVDFWPGSPQRVFTATWYYGDILHLFPSNPSYLELVVALVGGDADHDEFYLDNARLTLVPEPATMLLFGLAALPLLRRKR